MIMINRSKKLDQKINIRVQS